MGCPMGSQSEQEDQALQQYSRAQRGSSFPFLDEHVGNGLPRLEAVLTELEEIAKTSGRLMKLQVEPNLNVWVHRMLLRLWIRPDRVSYIVHRLTITLVHVRRWLSVGPCYRQIIVTDFNE